MFIPWSSGVEFTATTVLSNGFYIFLCGLILWYEIFTEHCEEEFLVKAYDQEQYEDYIERWFRGEETGARGVVQVSRYVRRWMITTFGLKCSICGWCEINPNTNSVPVHLDHIAGNWENTSPTNLRFLCPNHHALTATYGNQNRGKGRPYFVQKGLGV
jgi:hypothetical protein